MKNFNFKKSRGFTVIELLVSATIMVVIFSFVLANFRAGQYSGELDVISSQIVDGITTVRTMTLGGQLIDNPLPPPEPDRKFPEGGYGISFNRLSPRQFVLFADLGDPPNEILPNGKYDPGEEIPNGLIQFLNVDIKSLCDLSVNVVTNLPCQTPWDNIGNRLDIIFPVPGLVNAHDGMDSLPNQFVGGVLEHQKTGRQAYFYVSLTSGLVTGDEL